jgi:hypothetical protein
MIVRLTLVFGLIFSMFAHSVDGLTNAKIPSSLTDWQDWVRYQQEFRNCPNLNGQNVANQQNYLCAWPAKLKLNVQQTKVTFSQNWQVIEESKIPLPGDKTLWPQFVTVNQNKAVVLESQNRPYILLPKGQYEISGQIDWSQQPESLLIPQQVALVDLTLNGKQQAFVERKGSRIWLGRDKVVEVAQKDYLKVWVNRLVRDNHPMTMTVAVELEVGGSGREQKFRTV